MKKYIVLSKITGKRNRIFEKGSEVTEADLPVGSVKSLLNRKFIQEKSWEHPLSGEKIRLAIVTSVWGRPEVFQMFMSGINNILGTDFEINLVISQSMWSGDNEFTHLNNPSSYQNILSSGLNSLKIIEIPNEPLAAKVNATTYACRNLDVHYVLCMGSDDIISPELLNEYAIYMRKGIDFIGVTDCYFYDTVSGKSAYWGGYREPYRQGHTAGAFRALSARLLEQWDWMPWENKDSHGLDRSMQDKLKVTPHTIHTFSMRSKGMFALDIKSEMNMTPFKLWDNTQYIDTEIIKQQFPYIF